MSIFKPLFLGVGISIIGMSLTWADQQPYTITVNNHTSSTIGKPGYYDYYVQMTPGKTYCINGALQSGYTSQKSTFTFQISRDIGTCSARDNQWMDFTLTRRDNDRIVHHFHWEHLNGKDLPLNISSSKWDLGHEVKQGVDPRTIEINNK